MAFEQLKFEFPDDQEKGEELEIEIADAEEETAEAEEIEEAEAEEETTELDIEVVDDVPEEDRGRKVSDPPAEVTNEELKSYSKDVRNRIKHFSKGYHDERRAKEQAQREREELERYAQRLVGENRTLQGTVTKNQTALLEQAKRAAAGALLGAKAAYKKAYESGDSDAVLEAQDKLTSAKLKAERVSNYKLPPLQTEEGSVKTQQTESAPQPVDPKAQDWAAKNTWFGTDDEMTSFAYGVHHKLVKEGIDPQSDVYYEKVDSRMREIFPEQFGDVVKKEKGKKRKANVVAPATRSIAPKKVRLTQTQVSLAKRLGVPLEIYAQQVAEEMMRSQNG